MFEKFWPLFVLIAVGIVALVLIGLDTSGGGGGAVAEDEKDATTLPSGLKYIDVQVGDGDEAKTGNTVSVDYTGRLRSNKREFDTSVGKKPFEFKLGDGQVIRGWDEGVPGMKVGGKRKLIIPAKLGYGARGSGGSIPPNADLEFDVELLKVEK